MSITMSLDDVVFDWVENIVGKGENTGNQHFFLFQTMFSNVSFFRAHIFQCTRHENRKSQVLIAGSADCPLRIDHSGIEFIPLSPLTIV